MRITIFPNTFYNKEHKWNPYIIDFISALKDENVIVDNSPHKNPLFSLFFKKIRSDAYVFHWIENVPDYKWGYLQTLIAVLFILRIKFHAKKIIWFLHNKKTHTKKHLLAKTFITNIVIKLSDYIITHSTEGINLLVQKDKSLKDKAIFIHHPTKNRINVAMQEQDFIPKYDILIWGTISRYKGVIEFLRYAKEQKLTLKVKVLGRCVSEEVYQDLFKEITEYVDIEPYGVSFEELALHIKNAKYVLIPYFPDSILSSGILMDSLSFGAKVIGPDVGSFKDYSTFTQLNVYTFKEYNDIEKIIKNNNNKVSIKGYINFLEENSWKVFIRKILKLVKKD